MIREAGPRSTSRRRHKLGAFVLCALVLTPGHVPSVFGPLEKPTAVATLPAAGVVLAAGAGSGRRGTAQSNYGSLCASCHGPGGKGDGWRAWVFRLKMRDLTDPAYVQTLSDEYLFQIIKLGGATLGKPGMPSWGQELTDREIRDLIVYIRTLVPPSRSSQSPGAAS